MGRHLESVIRGKVDLISFAFARWRWECISFSLKKNDVNKQNRITSTGQKQSTQQHGFELRLVLMSGLLVFIFAWLTYRVSRILDSDT